MERGSAASRWPGRACSGPAAVVVVTSPTPIPTPMPPRTAPRARRPPSVSRPPSPRRPPSPNPPLWPVMPRSPSAENEAASEAAPNKPDDKPAADASGTDEMLRMQNNAGRLRPAGWRARPANASRPSPTPDPAPRSVLARRPPTARARRGRRLQLPRRPAQRSERRSQPAPAAGGNVPGPAAPAADNSPPPRCRTGRRSGWPAGMPGCPGFGDGPGARRRWPSGGRGGPGAPGRGGAARAPAWDRGRSAGDGPSIPGGQGKAPRRPSCTASTRSTIRIPP